MTRMTFKRCPVCAAYDIHDDWAMRDHLRDAHLLQALDDLWKVPTHNRDRVARFLKITRAHAGADRAYLASAEAAMDEAYAGEQG